MKTNLVSLTGFTLVALLAASTGCRTASSSYAPEQAESSHLQLPAGTVVRVRMPEEGRYYQALFQAPERYNPKSAIPRDWAPHWIADEDSVRLMGSTALLPAGGPVIPMLAGALAHGVGGLALYYTVGKPIPYPQDDQARDVAAMAAVSRSWKFELDLKRAVLDELRRSGLVAVEDRGASGAPETDANTSEVTLDLYIVAAGMISDRSFSKGVNPPQSLHLEVRAEVAGTSNSPVTMRIIFDSERARFREWAANGASAFATTRAESIQTVATDLAGRLTATPQPALGSLPETQLALQP